MSEDRRRRDVLLVEDDPDDVALLSEAVAAGRGLVSLKVVGDGRAALEYLRGEGRYADAARPALVRLDWRLPALSGAEVLREIRRSPELALLPVLVLTTSASEQDVAEAYRLGANCFLTKPTGLREIAALARAFEDFWLAHAVLPGKIPSRERRKDLTSRVGDSPTPPAV
ncbi:MAG: response regulator [Elusimicrobia bacterium]|nr:response regulator [Elusimicrobiota bacterium]